MNFIKRIFIRLVKNIELYNISNILIGANAVLSNGSILNASFGRIVLGSKVRIGNGSELVASKNKTIEIKDFSTLYSNCKVLGHITIERHCVLATNIYMSSGNHFAFEQPELLIRIQDQIARENNANINKHIHIHEDVWIGTNVFISPGITIGRGAIIGAGSIITKNVNPYEVVVGNPGKVIKNRLNFHPPINLMAQNQNDWPYFYQGFDQKNAFYNKNEKGLQLIDEGIIYLSNSASILTIMGFTSTNCLILTTINDETRSHEIQAGQFQINIKLSKKANSDYLVIFLRIEKSILNQHLFIHSVVGKA